MEKSQVKGIERTDRFVGPYKIDVGCMEKSQVKGIERLLITTPLIVRIAWCMEKSQVKGIESPCNEGDNSERC